MYLWQSHQYLTGFKTRQRFATSRGVPYITVFGLRCSLLCFHSFNQGFHGIKLIGAKYHRHSVDFVQHNVLAYHFAQVARLQKRIGKAIEDIGEAFVFYICPIKCLLKTLFVIVGKVFCIYPIADDEYLYILKQAITRKK